MTWEKYKKRLQLCNQISVLDLAYFHDKLSLSFPCNNGKVISIIKEVNYNEIQN